MAQINPQSKAFFYGSSSADPKEAQQQASARRGRSLEQSQATRTGNACIQLFEFFRDPAESGDVRKASYAALTPNDSDGRPTQLRSVKALSGYTERAPSVTWRQLWLDFVVDTSTMDDPAPFCWPDFKLAVVDTVPIFSPHATPSNTNTSISEIQAAQAYATGYWASDDRIKFDRAAAKNQHAAGRKAVVDYLHKKRAEWKIQSKVDAALEENGVNMHAIAQPDLGGVRAPFRCYADAC
ncbi:hypothetical protein ACG7TL_007858 [Trametes sanguinea]